MSEVSVEDQAKELGWSPKEQWRGDPDKWIDADTFVKRGEEILPILRANNRKLQEDISSLKNELASTRDLLKTSSDAIEALKDFNSDANKEKMLGQRQALMDKLKEARQDGNVEEEVKITERLTETNTALRKAEEKPAVVQPQPDTSPEWLAWKSENPWFGKETRKSSVAIGIAAELRREHPTLTGKAFFDKLTSEVETTLGGNPRRTNGKVEEGGRRDDGGGTGSKKSYADLPSDAKAACDNFALRLVGPGRAFKTQEEQRASYVKKFFEQE